MGRNRNCLSRGSQSGTVSALKRGTAAVTNGRPGRSDSIQNDRRRDDLEERRPAVDVPLIVILPGLLALAVLPYKLVPENSLEAQAGVPLLKRPIFWAAVVFVVFVALNIIIW